MAKYVDMSAKLEIKAEDLFQASVKKTEPPQGGLFVVSDGEVSWKGFDKEILQHTLSK
jgi:hypothetical protein